MAEGIFEGLAGFTSRLSGMIPLATEANAAISTLAGGVSNLLKEFENGATTLEDYRIRLTLASGATSDFVGKLRSEAYELNKFGVSFKDLVAINERIAESYSRATFSAAQRRSDFNDERIQVQELIAVNEKFGASSNQTINILNKLGNSVFTNVNQVKLFSDTLLKFSKETGQSFGNTLKEFDSYYSRFITSLDSNRAIQSFTTLELLARRSGSSVQQLVSSISKFDDIDEAFSTGGQINRVLSQFGGSFDTLAAANASEEEKAQMLLQSVADIKDRFNATMTNPNARRQVLNEIVKQTGLPMETITGLLKDGQTLSADLQSIIKTPVTTRMEGISEADRQKMAMDVTRKSDVEEIAKENLKIGPLTMALERMITNQKTMILDVSSQLGTAVDKSFKDVLTGKSNVVEFLNDLGAASKSVESVLRKSDIVEKILGGDLSQVPEAIADSFKKNIGGVASDKVQEAYDQHIIKLAATDAAREKREETFRQQHAEAVGKSVTAAIKNINVIGEVILRDQYGNMTGIGKLSNAQ